MSRGGLFRHQSTDKSEDVGTNSDRRRAVVLQREVDYGYADTVGGLLATSHGRAVQAAATRRKRRAMNGDELEVAITSLRSEAGSSPGSFRAAFDAGRGQQELLFPSPTVVEWRFSSPAAPKTTDERLAESTTPAARAVSGKRIPTAPVE